MISPNSTLTFHFFKSRSGKVLALVKAFITKKNIGKYLDDLPEVSYDFTRKKTERATFTYSEVGSYIYYLSVTTVAACMLFNIVKSNKLF